MKMRFLVLASIILATYANESFAWTDYGDYQGDERAVPRHNSRAISEALYCPKAGTHLIPDSTDSVGRIFYKPVNGWRINSRPGKTQKDFREIELPEDLVPAEVQHLPGDVNRLICTRDGRPIAGQFEARQKYLRYNYYGRPKFCLIAAREWFAC